MFPFPLEFQPKGLPGLDHVYIIVILLHKGITQILEISDARLIQIHVPLRSGVSQAFFEKVDEDLIIFILHRHFPYVHRQVVLRAGVSLILFKVWYLEFMGYPDIRY
jgi:hypothetical protein